MATPDYPGSAWQAASSNNYTASNRESTYDINKVIIHVTQGSWSAAMNWFANPNAGASAHYVVRSADGFVGQSVQEKDVAYHCGNWAYNTQSVGIEHEGYASDPSWFTDAMIRSSAKLTAYLCKKYAVPVDRTHIIGHNEVPNPYQPGQYGGVDGHTDPGPYWPWDKYMSYVRSYSTSYAQVVDNTTTGRFSAGSAWATSSYGAQRYGADYRFQKPGTTTNYASYKINVPAAGNYAVYGWWPANPGYNGSTVFQIYTASGWVNKVVSQRANGGTWVALGTFAMNAGDNWWIRIPNRSSTAGYIIADAVKIVRQ